MYRGGCKPLVLIVLALLVAGVVPSRQLHAQERIALVLGNAAYTGDVAALANPSNDANDMAEKLKASGWKVLQSTDLGRRDMNRRLGEFRDQLKANPGSVALFFYAGHGVQVGGKNYLLPVGEIFETNEDVQESAFLVDRVVDVFTETKARQSVIILDACRDNPLAKATRSAAASRGLALVPANETAEEGSAVIFATAPNDVAADGSGRNGVFTAAVLKFFDQGLPLTDLFKQVRDEVRQVSGGKQNPSIVTAGLLGSLYLGRSTAATIAVPAPQPQPQPQPVPVAAAPAMPQSVLPESFTLKVTGPQEGLAVYIDGQQVGLTPFLTTVSRQMHSVRVEHPDWQPWTATAKPSMDGTTELVADMVRSVAWQLNDLKSKKQPLAERLGLVNKDRAGWEGLETTGWILALAGTASALGGYFMGDAARSAYDSATTKAAVTAARNNVETANYLFQAGILGGSGGLLSALISAIAKPDTSALQRQVADIDARIKDLEGAK